MLSAFRRAAYAACVLLLAACAKQRPVDAVGGPSANLTVCADPDNMPFSSIRGEGFENRIAELVAADFGLPLRYVWLPQPRGLAHDTLNAGVCELIIGVPYDYEFAATTRPYYRSSYVFVTATDSGLDIRSFDDPRLPGLRVGLHAAGENYASVSPAPELAARDIYANSGGYRIQDAYEQADPPARLLEALAAGEIDVAIAWGPLAAYFSQRQRVPLQVFTPAEPASSPSVPMRFSISMAVRHEDSAFRERLDALLEQRSSDIVRILDDYGVPLAVVPIAGVDARLLAASP